MIKANLNKAFSVFIALLVVSASTNAAWADPAVKFSGTILAGNEVSFPGTMRGWEFDVTQATGVTVSKIGVYDRDADGLGEAHEVFIWDADRNIIASSIVPSGFVAPLDENNLFRLVDTPDFLLPQGDGYVIGTYYSFRVDGFDSQVSGLVTHPSIRFVETRFYKNAASPRPSAKRVYPNLSSSQQPQLRGYFGPGFEIVPEPTSLALVFGGTLSLLITRIRSK